MRIISFWLYDPCETVSSFIASKIGLKSSGVYVGLIVVDVFSMRFSVLPEFLRQRISSLHFKTTEKFQVADSQIKEKLV